MNGKLIRIQTVAQSAKDKTYARDILGNTYFPQNADMELKGGMYAYAIEALQTKGRDENGDLYDLPTPVKINQITAVFGTKEEAIEGASEVGLLNAQVAANVQAQAKELKLDDAAISRLAQVW
jgi:hypothetical protein